VLALTASSDPHFERVAVQTVQRNRVFVVATRDVILEVRGVFRFGTRFGRLPRFFAMSMEGEQTMGVVLQVRAY
jgi:hypothetical protein